MTLEKQLTAEINAFLTNSGMFATHFGVQAMNDPGFVFDLRKGRRVWPHTADKVRAYINDNSKAA